MDVLDAICNRYSVRDFLPTPLPKATVLNILETALRSPSGGNSQPWEVFIASGASLERIRKVYQERFHSGAASPPRPAAPGSPSPLPEAIQARFTAIRNERMRLLGLDPADPDSFKVFMEWGSRLFGVPALAVICMDEALSSYLDIGLFVQTVCLAAQGFGVDSLIASAFVTHPDILRQELEIPPAYKIVTGIGLGFPNQQAVINTYRSPRRPLEEVVRFRE